MEHDSQAREGEYVRVQSVPGLEKYNYCIGCVLQVNYCYPKGQSAKDSSPSD